MQAAHRCEVMQYFFMCTYVCLTMQNEALLASFCNCAFMFFFIVGLGRKKRRCDSVAVLIIITPLHTELQCML